LLPKLFRRNGITCDEIRGRAIRVSAACIRSRSSRISKRCGRPCLPENTTPACAPMATATASAHRPRRRVHQPPSNFALLVWHLAGTRNLPGRHCKKTFSGNKLIDKLAAKFGPEVHEVPSAFKYICELMLEQNILIGGEESGGIGTSLYIPERDATVSALLLAELMGLAR